MTAPVPSATYEPQGTCPNAWVARIDGKEIRTSAGGVRRYGSEAAAIKKARAVIDHGRAIKTNHQAEKATR